MLAGFVSLYMDTQLKSTFVRPPCSYAVMEQFQLQDVNVSNAFTFGLVISKEEGPSHFSPSRWFEVDMTVAAEASDFDLEIEATR